MRACIFNVVNYRNTFAFSYTIFKLKGLLNNKDTFPTYVPFLICRELTVSSG